MGCVVQNQKSFNNKQYQSYIALLVHDLKTPLSAQLKILELLLNNTFGEITPEQKQILFELIKSSEYALNLVHNVLESYMYEQNKITLNKEIFVWNNFLSDILSKFSFLLKDKNLILSVKANSNSQNVFGDRINLKRAVANLLSNALYYAKKNSVIYIDSQIKNKHICLSITNTASYILPVITDSFFDKFNKKSAASGTVNGSGLGLYIVKQIITAHGGEVFGRNINSDTCTFGFRIPV